ncbi:putative PRONE domain, Rop guanine nucleotide exchange factor [Helianthus annuus]|uniref:PRONE domain, Rop guanine nucleotide exchange factor n=1 Tax=Helianthus annuus TaxID=4232 RepID=A0A251VAG9_HELAN|nr:rop guanine nucleotide exchange factor 14 isoform X1 [Helianthus annuus]KAF5815679.1 putative PRONE domain, Rop guanine nucleotide exchange factor [Helianthus annuus]KAJ0594099.1 putative PRONE domain, Rop guanine nucleotide exchange factor [Helianthus annuus]KAJ0602198.1 putative PRONE domain, Rop guanine nucleotide exchange factor [Helianthus annuus]KAJ0609120.1 putative PRONE domain, Rop guanine nucleotide exchange factor [Helianthus annuus]KAJ0769186.1 putative PRONE domain, Rop guanine
MVLLNMRLSCCTWNREMSNRMEFDQPPDRIMTYDGLESCILNANNSYEDESVASKVGDRCPTDSPSSCCSSNNASGSFFSQWSMVKRDEHEWDYSEDAMKFSDVDVMKEKFAKLLLGEDTTGGRNGVSPALALSNAITNLAGTVFGELWKLEPLPDEKKNKWRREMDWLLSPTNYMVQLVPAKQCGPDGQTIEIMTPQARGDVHLNLPALQKLDSMLLETLDSMTETEFSYDEGGSRAEGRSKRWWLPAPQVPVGGLSDGQRKKLLTQAKLVLQIFKAAKSVNEAILLEMPIPKAISDVLPKSGKESLGEDLYRILNRGSSSACDMCNALSLKSENSALDAINRLEAAIYAWKDKIEEHDSGKSPARTSWSCKDHVAELDKIELLISRAESLAQEIKIRYPDLPQKFLDVMKIQNGKDVAHAIIEAYSRVLGNLAFSILTRIGDISQEDVLSDPDSPMATNSTPGPGSWIYLD